MSSVNNNKPVTAETFSRIHEGMLANFDKAVEKTDGRKILMWTVGDDPDKRRQLQDALQQAHEVLMQMMQGIAKAAEGGRSGNQ